MFVAGALGVRTRFQEKAVSQLQVLIKRKSNLPMTSLVERKNHKTLPKVS